ncbi:MAG: hypothetical protein ACYDH9_06855 [Limisphaerales bacterium]
MGQSAGGYLTLMTGFRLRPRPRALVSFWGYGGHGFERRQTNIAAGTHRQAVEFLNQHQER